MSTTPLAQQLQRLLTQNALALFADYGVELVVVPETESPMGSLVHCGILGFTGEALSGTLMLACSVEALQSSTFLPDGASIADGIGELANQLLGRLKLDLIARSQEIAISTPIVIRGEHLVPVHARVMLRPLQLAPKDGGVVCIWLDHVAHCDLVLADEVEAIASAGDSMFFFDDDMDAAA